MALSIFPIFVMFTKCLPSCPAVHSGSRLVPLLRPFSFSHSGPRPDWALSSGPRHIHPTVCRRSPGDVQQAPGIQHHPAPPMPAAHLDPFPAPVPAPASHSSQMTRHDALPRHLPRPHANWWPSGVSASSWKPSKPALLPLPRVLGALAWISAKTSKPIAPVCSLLPLIR